MDTKSKERGTHVPVVVIPAIAVEKLFVYGIFLDERHRRNYEMENPEYDTVRGYITVGGSIVQAIPSSTDGACLTGLLVDVPTRKLPALDVLEAGYDRIVINTTSGYEAFMYANRTDKENHSSYRSNMYEQE